MNDLGKIHQLIIPFHGHDLTFNLGVIGMTWTIFILLIILGFLAARKRARLPGPLQIVGELIWSSLYRLVEDALGEEKAKVHAPYVCALFMFLLSSNWIGIVPLMEEPTKDLNTPLSFGLMGFVIAHTAGIKSKGFKGYAREYLEPFFFMLPLNIIDELAKVVSISFRLFGNIMGGSIIILVVSHLVFSLVLPPALYVFFGIFVGAIQAFVFTMLTVVYISLKVN